MNTYETYIQACEDKARQCDLLADQAAGRGEHALAENFRQSAILHRHGAETMRDLTRQH